MTIAPLNTPAMPVHVPAVAPLLRFSQQRRDFVQQRPQHPKGRFAADRPVWFWEEMNPADHH